MKEKASIPIGELGFQFIKTFGGTFLGGEATRILSCSEKSLCMFNNGKHHQYTLAQLKQY